MSKVRFYGITRFSTFLPGANAWAMTRRDGLTEAEYKEQLYSAERMQPRLDIFTGLAAPIYQQMAEKYNYRHIVHYTETLPRVYLEQLQAAAEEHPVLALNRVEGKIDNRGTAQADLQSAGADSGTVVLFRVDDDDLLSIDYLDRLSAYAKPQFEGFAVSFGLGVGGLYSGNQYTEFRKIHGRLPSQGQAYIGRYDRETGVLRMPRTTSHTKQDTVSPVIYDSRHIAYIYTFHEHQDVGANTTLEQRFGRHPLLEAGTNLTALFPTLRGVIAARSS